MAPAQPPATRGFNLALTAQDPATPYETFLAEIVATGANAVSFLIPYYQSAHDSVAIREVPGKTPTIATVSRLARAAREMGLETKLLPIVLLEDDTSDEWRGSLAPVDVDAWFAAWQQRVSALAQVAEQEDVAWISIGSEFSSLQVHDARWRALIEQTRSIYNGNVVYTANWDTPDTVAWWDATDAMAVSVYFELAPERAQASDAELAESAVEWKQWLLAVRDQHAADKPLLFSEVGFPSIVGATSTPWDYTLTGPSDFEEQRRGFEAFIRAWDGEPALAGAFVYTWVEYRGEPERGYSPRGKPAEELLRLWFGKTTPALP